MSSPWLRARAIDPFLGERLRAADRPGAAAVSGDEIWVQAGLINQLAGTDRSAAFPMKSGVAIYGGFAGSETSRVQRDWVANGTILSGDIGAAGNNSDNSYHVVTGADNATLDGVTITGGNANGSNHNDIGAGVYNWNSSPLLTNIIIRGNSASNMGGGMFNFNNSPVLINITFSGNTAGAGGALNNFVS